MIAAVQFEGSNPGDPAVTAEVRQEVRDNLEFYRGIIRHKDLGVLYEVTRWSEVAVKQSLQRYIYSMLRIEKEEA